jgi:hypothetical protein
MVQRLYCWVLQARWLLPLLLVLLMGQVGLLSCSVLVAHAQSALLLKMLLHLLLMGLRSSLQQWEVWTH